MPSYNIVSYGIGISQLVIATGSQYIILGLNIILVLNTGSQLVTHIILGLNTGSQLVTHIILGLNIGSQYWFSTGHTYHTGSKYHTGSQYWFSTGHTYLISNPTLVVTPSDQIPWWE